jgi:hypothetical protein
MRHGRIRKAKTKIETVGYKHMQAQILIDSLARRTTYRRVLVIQITMTRLERRDGQEVGFPRSGGSSRFA